MKYDPNFWQNYNAAKHAALTHAKNQTRLVWFAIVYLSVTTAFFLWLLAAIALGKAALPDRFVNTLMAITVGQFAGAPILLYKAMFRKEGTKK